MMHIIPSRLHRLARIVEWRTHALLVALIVSFVAIDAVILGIPTALIAALPLAVAVFANFAYDVSLSWQESDIPPT